ncbi:MAG TPA: hypothetical protein VFU02_03490, partial [Polyangiaceae bacterium]|nr:hypothetical protein [Polyangiaceae bacterium]
RQLKHLLDDMVKQVPDASPLKPPEVARRIASLRADRETRQRLDELAAKANERGLTRAGDSNNRTTPAEVCEQSQRPRSVSRRPELGCGPHRP